MPSAEKTSYLPVNAADPPCTQDFELRAEFARRLKLTKVLFITFVLCLFWWQPYLSQYRPRPSNAPPLGLPKDLQRSWGQYSPWFPVRKYLPPPVGCEITQVNILQRHGARYPNEDDDYDKSVRKLSSAKKFKDNRLDFLIEYQYDLDEEDLTAFGAAQSFESGETAFKRYAQLVHQDNIPFVRSSSLSRVQASARNWTVGFAASSQQRYNPTLDVIISESQNDTLNNDCPNAGEGEDQKNAWLSVFAPPIRKRLEKDAPGASLSDHDIFNLLAMCPFETMATQKASDFCALFTKEEFLQFEYHGDVEKYYKTGYGERLGPIQGVGYINELLARLTGRPVQDHTQHDDSLPFPLGRTIYADFTHENLMVAVFSAMGLFNQSDNPLSTKKMDKDRTWVASRMVPFSARMVVEKLACGTVENGEEQEEFVRILVNDDLQPLKFCGAGQEKICTLYAFVKSQEYSRHDGHGDFKRCYR